jgi:alpha-amylase/alpha-mannosidase (GH57 family)
MHQPRYNLVGPAYESEIAVDVFRQTMHPYTYPTEVIKNYEKAKVTFNYTGSLVEQLNELMNVDFDPRLKGLWDRFRELKRLESVEFTGCGYFHPIFPLIPEEDRRKQIEMHLELYKETFGGKPKGLWLPELAFRMNVIPILEEMGFKWVIVDGSHVVNANKGKDRNELLYRPHYAEYDGHSIIVIPRDRDISNAQQSGYSPSWLKNEVEHKIQPFNDGSMLLTVATDGENGWFRHFGANAGFWGWFFEPLLYLLNRDSDFQFINLTTINEYLEEHPPKDTIAVEDGSWNVPETFDDGRFLKWTEGKGRQEAWANILETSKLVHEVSEKIEKLNNGRVTGLRKDLEQAWKWLLIAEASDYFWWGSEDWLNRSKICCMKAKGKVKEISRML